MTLKWFLEPSLYPENPLDDWPKDIIFFLRVASLLHGLSVQLKAKVPFFQIILERAEQAVREAGAPAHPLAQFALIPSPAKFPVAFTEKYSSSFGSRTLLEWQVHQLLVNLIRSEALLGCQVSVWYKRIQVVDVSAGQMGPYDGRPVTSKSLFMGFSLSNILLVTMILHLVAQQKLKLTDCVSEWWDGFIQAEKRDITVEQLLTHQSGLHNWLPSNLTMSQLTNYRAMIKLAEAAPLVCKPGECGHYPFYCCSWIFSELIAHVSKTGSTSKYFRSSCLKEWDLRHLSKQIYFPCPVRSLEIPGANNEIEQVTTPEDRGEKEARIDLGSPIATPPSHNRRIRTAPSQRPISDSPLRFDAQLDDDRIREDVEETSTIALIPQVLLSKMNTQSKTPPYEDRLNSARSGGTSDLQHRML